MSSPGSGTATISLPTLGSSSFIYCFQDCGMPVRLSELLRSPFFVSCPDSSKCRPLLLLSNFSSSSGDLNALYSVATLFSDALKTSDIVRNLDRLVGRLVALAFPQKLEKFAQPRFYKTAYCNAAGRVDYYIFNRFFASTSKPLAVSCIQLFSSSAFSCETFGVVEAIVIAFALHLLFGFLKVGPTRSWQIRKKTGQYPAARNRRDWALSPGRESGKAATIWIG